MQRPSPSTPSRARWRRTMAATGFKRTGISSPVRECCRWPPAWRPGSTPPTRWSGARSPPRSRQTRRRRSEKGEQAVTLGAAGRMILLYGTLGWLVIFALTLFEYRFLVLEHSLEIYGGLVALR